MLDDDQPAIRAAQKAEKTRKAELAKAQKTLEKAQRTYAENKVDLYGESSAANYVSIRAQRRINDTVAELTRALEAIVKREKYRRHTVDDFGMVAEAQRLQPRSERMMVHEVEARAELQAEYEKAYYPVV
jgi:hypothetical protein